MLPIIGITVDNRNNTASSGTYECAIRYPRAVAAAGGLPVLLPHEIDRVEQYLALCDGLILTGGVDPDTRLFASSQPLHARARVMDPSRQAFETALLDGVSAKPRAAGAGPQTAVLGVCLGMQLMALHAGGRLNQYLPDTLGDEAAAAHQKDRRHTLTFEAMDSVVRPSGGAVVSSHCQAVEDAGSLRVVARAADGVIEAIDDPGRPFYVGVQWHPERGDSAAACGLAGSAAGSSLNHGLIAALVDAARAAR